MTEKESWELLLLVLVITSLLLSNAVAQYFHVKKEEVESAKAAHEELKDVMLSKPSWVGHYQDNEIQVVITQIRSDTQYVKAMNTDLKSLTSLGQITVVNYTDKQKTIDCSNVLLRKSDGSTIESMNYAAVKANLVRNKEIFEERIFSKGVIPEQQHTDNLFFLSGDFDWTEIVSVTVKIDEKEVTAIGKYLTPEEKAEMYRER